MTTPEYTGHVILLMAPTGSGKGSIVRYIRNQYPDVVFPVSCTTRDMRPTEQEGVDYYYLTEDAFATKIEQGEFLEWATFGGRQYGTLKTEFLTPLQNGKVLMAEIELQGVESLTQLIPRKHFTIVYIDAGSWEVMRERALARAPMSEEELALRYERYVHEVAAKPIADVVIDNTDGQLEAANKHMKQVVEDTMLKLNSSI